MQLHSPWYLLLVPVLAAVAAWALRLRRPSVRVSDLRPFRESGARRSWRHPTQWPIILMAAGLLLLCVALTRPRKGIEIRVERTRGIDIVLALDVSGSMQAYDVPAGLSPREVERRVNTEQIRSRIEVAKEELRRFVEGRPDDRIGLIAFAKRPYTVCPPTLDHDFLIRHLRLLDAGMLEDGTGLAAPVASAVSKLRDSPAKRRVVVLFTDGENNVEAQITPVQAAELADTFDVTVHTVGVGSDNAYVAVRQLFGGWDLRPVAAGLGAQARDLLRRMAEETTGRYFPARDAEGFAAVMREIDRLETTDLEVPRYMDYRERFFPWLAAGLALVIAAYLLEHTLLQSVP